MVLNTIWTKVTPFWTLSSTLKNRSLLKSVISINEYLLNDLKGHIFKIQCSNSKPGVIFEIIEMCVFRVACPFNGVKMELGIYFIKL